MLLPQEFYKGNDVVGMARELIGKIIFTRTDDGYSSGMISETEAYAGGDDKAFHAYGNRRTKRTEVMYAMGGRAYVYLCYGVHCLFNVVSNGEDIPHAILVRGIFPLEGKELMEQRRNRKYSGKDFTNGPGKVSQALGIDLSFNGELLNGARIGIEDRAAQIPGSKIKAGPRIGVDYAGADAQLPFRFVLDADLCPSIKSRV